jgi:hypothetical protein
MAKNRKTARELYVQLNLLNVEIENILLGYALDYGKIDFPSKYQFALQENNYFNVAGIELIDEVHGYIMWDKPNANSEMGRDIMSNSFTLLDRMRTLETIEVVIKENNLKTMKQIMEETKNLTDSEIFKPIK